MALDGLRGFAVLSVVFVHCALPGFPGGTHGVDVFFVLSGYLITTLLVAESERPETVDIRAFWRRRFRRLMPALAALVLAYVAIAPLLLPEVAHLRWRDAAAALTYTMNLDLLAERRMTGLGHLWSLALEAQFYLLWPAVVLLLRRLRNPAAALLIAWLLVTATRFYAAAWDVQLGYHVVHFSGMILGAALVFLPRLPGWTAWLGLWVLVMLVVGSDPGRYFANTSFGVMAAEIGTAMMLPALTGESALARLFSWRPLVAVGTISYGIYIWHFPIQRVIWEQPWAIDTAVTLGGALVCAALSYRFIERSGSRQKRTAAEFAAQPAAGST